MPLAAEANGRPLGRRCLAEGLGTALFVATLIGSGIAAQRLSVGDVGLQLLENSLVTGAGLVALILALQPVSAAFNPAVTVVERALGAITTRAAASLILAQEVGGVVAAILANVMFELPAWRCPAMSAAAPACGWAKSWPRSASSSSSSACCDQRPTRLDHNVVDAADVAIIRGCGETCLVFSGKRYEDWPLTSRRTGHRTVRRIVADFDGRVGKLLSDLGVIV